MPDVIHTLDQIHWDMIIEFIGYQAQKDGVVDQGEMVDLMRQWWHFISDKGKLETRLAMIHSKTKSDEILKLRTRLTELEG